MSGTVTPPTVWSERRPGSWDQCTECAYLMVLELGGFAAFPLGAHSDAERDALDAAGEPDPPGGGSTFAIIDRGAQRRYGLHLRTIPDGSREGLERALRRPGRALAVAGTLGAFAPGSRLRRWQPDYTAGHAVAVLTAGDGLAWWLDPLAPSGTPADFVSIRRVLEFAWYPSDARIAALGEFGGEDVTWIDQLEPGEVKGTRTPCRAHLPQGTSLYPRPGGDPDGAVANAAGRVVRVVGLVDHWAAYVQAEGGLRFFHQATADWAHPLVDATSLAADLDTAERTLARIRTLARQALAIVDD